MTQPYYTAVPVQTAGPVDPNAGLRAKLYTGLAVITPLLGFLATFNIVTTDQANAITGFITAGMGLLGVFGFGLAATKTKTQVKDGTFDPAPAPAPAQTAVEGIAAVAQQFNDLTSAVAAGVQRVQDVAGGLATAVGVTGLGALLPGSLAAQVAQQAAQQAGGASLFGQGPAPTPASVIPGQ